MVDGHKIEFIISVRGKLQIVIDDFPFCRNEKHKEKTYYICCQSKILGFVALNLLPVFLLFLLVNNFKFDVSKLLSFATDVQLEPDYGI